MMDLADLNARFGLEEQLSFHLLNENMVVAEVRSSRCTARIALQGAQVLEWAPEGQKPVLWLSKGSNFIPGKSIRGGTPVCWPWFGAHDSKSDYPAHGHARTVDWDVLSSESLTEDRIKLVFCLKTSQATEAVWPYRTPLELHITLGDRLELELITRNDEAEPISIGEALHTYFAVGDVRQVAVSGLNACEYLDKVNDFARCTQQDKVSFNSEVDRVYLNTEAECVIEDACWERNIRIKKRGSHSTIVWNPWIEKALAMGDMGKDGYLNMVCVESGNAAENVVVLKPGEEHRLWVEYSVDN